MYAMEYNKRIYPQKPGGEEIHSVLLRIGIPPHLLGYTYILTAIELISIDSLYLQNITKGLYADIALRHNTSALSVERAIRNAINIGWLRGDIGYIDEMFKNCINPNRGVPSNSLFLRRLFYYFDSADYK